LEFSHDASSRKAKSRGRVGSAAHETTVPPVLVGVRVEIATPFV